MNATVKNMTSLIFAATATITSAATSIHVDSVAQRWPWNNKVDITYTVRDGQDVSASKFYKIVFTTVIDGVTYTIDGSTLGASANTDTHTVTWIAPAGLRCANCTMSAAIYDSDVPSGNDYMIVDLTTGDITYEGLFGLQAESNTRYNTATYKTDKLVLRKVPAGGPYVVLGDATDSSIRTRSWSTDRDYYIGIFPVTQRQYELVGADSGSTPSLFKTSVEGNPASHRPVEQVSYSDLRTGIESTNDIPVVTSPETGTFFQRLGYMTGNRYSFDLPTDIMFVIAARAGVSQKYFYGSDTADSSKFDCTENSYDRPMPVGSKDANAWGLYDVNGNVWERGRDNFVNAELQWAISPTRQAFTPVWRSHGKHTWLGGGDHRMSYTTPYFRLDMCAGDATDSNDRLKKVGFRVSVIMD